MKNMNHTEYPKSLRTKTDAELYFTIKDAKEAMQAMPDNPNNSYYADEVCYCSDELRRRRRAEAAHWARQEELTQAFEARYC